MKNSDIAAAFVHGIARSAGSAVSSGEEYFLHGNKIAMWHGDSIIFNWCGYYTATTARHMNNILRAVNAAERVSYAEARDNDHTAFAVKAERD